MSPAWCLIPYHNNRYAAAGRAPARRRRIAEEAGPSPLLAASSGARNRTVLRPGNMIVDRETAKGPK